MSWCAHCGGSGECRKRCCEIVNTGSARHDHPSSEPGKCKDCNGSGDSDWPATRDDYERGSESRSGFKPWLHRD